MIFEFRGKDSFNGNWIYGDLTRTNPEGSTSYKINNNLVNLNTISIYLNHKDNNNNKIFNYDIINVNNENNYLIFYNKYQCAYCLLKLDELSINFFIDNLDVITILPDKNWWLNNNIKIIGNLFDNPDLLYGLNYDKLIKYFY